jgi:integrase/recombinase XerD
MNANYENNIQDYYHYLITLGYQARGVRTKTRLLNYFLKFISSNRICEIGEICGDTFTHTNPICAISVPDSYRDCGSVSLQSITSKDIQAYYTYLQNRPNKRTGEKLNPKTIAHYIRSVELFFMHLQQNGIIQAIPILAIQKENTSKTNTTYIRSILSQQEAKTLYRHTKNALERLILSLGYGCGLRVGELVKLNIADINLADKILIIPSGKGNKRRIVPMSKGVCKAIKFYMEDERINLNHQNNCHAEQLAPLIWRGSRSAPIILDSKGNRMQQWTYNKILKQIINRTNDIHIINKNITMHSLRHSIATHLLEQGLSLEQVKQFLGHAYLQTTEIYTHITNIQLANASIS